MSALLSDLAYAARGWLSNPLLALVAAASLALGIGVNVAIFSIYEQIVLRPLPVPQPERLVNLTSPGPKQGSTSSNFTGSNEAIFSQPMYRDLAERADGFESLAAHRLLTVSLSVGGATQVGAVMAVSGNYFDTLRLQPAVGRLLGAQDDGRQGPSTAAVVSHRFWQQRLSADPSIIDRSLRVNGELLTVVGVAPPGFDGSSPGRAVDVFVPLGLHWRLEPLRRDGSEDRRNYWIYVFGRLADGFSVEQAQRAINRPYQALIRDVDLPLQEGMDDTMREAFAAREILLEDGSSGQSRLAANAGPGLTVLWAVSALVLLIACMNVANLLLARGSARIGELAVRASVGASRGRLLRLLLSEATALGLLGLLISLPIAALVMRLVRALLPDGAAQGITLSLDATALGFAAATALLTVILFGLFPAWQLARTAPISVLRSGGTQAVGRVAARFRAALATTQVALSMASLVIAGLFTQSLLNINAADPGMQIDTIAGFSVSPRRIGYDNERTAQMFDAIEERLRAVPGVVGVTSSMVPLLSGSNWGTDVAVEGFEGGSDVDRQSLFNEVGDGFFATLGLPLLLGREFEPADRADRPLVAVVNRAFAEKFGLGNDPIGKRLNSRNEADLNVEIVGLVADAGYDDVRRSGQPQFFMPRRQSTQHDEMVFYARSRSTPEALLPALAAAVAELDPALPVENLRTLPQQVSESITTERMVGVLSSGFSLLATVLAAVGLYGVVSYTLSMRMREFGLRLALGAPPTRLRAMVLGQTAKMAAIGGAIGLLLALLVGRAASALLFGLEPHDPSIMLAAVVLLAAVALVAAWLPARSAQRIDPLVALRHD